MNGRARRGLIAGALAVAAVLGLAGAHAGLEAAEPPPGGVHVGELELVVLRFGMPVETRFSRFDLYRLAVADDALPADGLEPTARELQRLEALAGAFLTDAPEDALADALVVAAVRETGASDVVTLEPEAPLPPGIYLVAWEVLATDAHTTLGRHVFLVAAP